MVKGFGGNWPFSDEASGYIAGIFYDPTNRLAIAYLANEGKMFNIWAIVSMETKTLSTRHQLDSFLSLSSGAYFIW